MKPSPSNRKRARKAYRVTSKILISYLRIFLAKRIFGKAYYEKRIERVHTKNAQRIKETIVELQGLFTKVGQLLSIMSNILPEQYMEVLESLQDQAPASPFDAIKKMLEDELDEPIEQLFSDFEETPIASASIGQVYRARLKSGEDVAVKVQHPDVHELAEADLNSIQTLIKRISWFIKIGGIEHVYGQVRIMIKEELDYEKEANSMIVINDNIADEEGIIIPKVYTEYSSKRVLVTEFHDAAKITDTEQLDSWGIDRNEVAERLVLVYCKMILEDGIYHADPHPGNVLINKNGELILLDFGAVAVLDEKMRKEIPVIIQAIIRKDNPKILASLKRMGFIGNDKESQKIAGKLIDALSQFIRNEVEIENMNFKDLKFDDIKGSSLDNLRKEISIKELTKTIQVPKDWILLERTLMLIMGTSSALAPEFKPMDVIKPYLKKLVIKDGGIKNIILDTLKQQFSTLLGLPTELNNFLKKANNGELELEIKNPDTKIYAGIQQLMLALLMLASVSFYLIDERIVFVVAASAFGVLLLRSVWKNKR